MVASYHARGLHLTIIFFSVLSDAYQYVVVVPYILDVREGERERERVSESYSSDVIY